MQRSTKTRAQRHRLVAAWRASGTSQAAFARRHHIHPRTFFDWIHRCPAPPAPAATFVPVEVVASPARSPTRDPLTILLPRGERLEVPPETPAAWVAAIVAGLRAAC